MMKINGHELGFRFYRGWNALRPESPKTLRLVVMDKDIHGKSTPYRVKNYETQKAQNLQIILPDNLKFAEEMGNFLIDPVKNAKSGI